MFKVSSSLLPTTIRSFSRRSVHLSAQQGFTLESGTSYEQGRPSYSTETSDLILDVFWKNIGGRNTDPSKRFHMVELGAGTGKFTESFVSHFLFTEKGQLHITAVEPSEGFRKILVDKALHHVRAVHGTGDHIPVETHSADAVVVAQAFHWMANTNTLKEVHRVLKPNAPLVLVWNTYDYSKEWMRIVDKEILTPTYGDTPRQQTEKWRLCFNEPEGKKLFSTIHSWYNPYNFSGDRQMVLNRFLSTSVIVQLQESEKNKVIKRLEDILDNHPDFRYARITGKYEIPYTTHVAWVYAK